ncbi:MAG: endonuclease/exonuclease/phosphatase family protein [Acidobacteria bacterium]|nr:endonuclease/exonuclease/phosphatase family protein [Acidobacteriota bacterium]
MFSWLTHRSGRGTLGVLLVAAAFVLGLTAAPASADSDKRVVKVMTYNMDAGTDFVFFFAYPNDLAAAYAATVDELAQSGFDIRAARMADVIAAEDPYLVSLQEATVWDYVTNGGSRIQLLADQLELLMAALEERGLHYKIVAVQPLTNLMLPLGDDVNFHYLDQNVILARTDLSQAELALSNARQAQFLTTSEPLPGFRQVNGWMSVDAKIRGKSVRFFATHLASPLFPGDPVQEAQGAELVEILSGSPFPVMLAGDFNSDMSGLGIGPDQTPTASAIVAAGYADSWTAVHQTWEGLTWPLFWEDIYAGVYPDGEPVERIDLIFAKGLEVLDAKAVGVSKPYPSDHAGVVATLLIEK